MDLEGLLGIDMSRPEDQHASALVAADARMLDDLINLREAQNLTQTQVAERMGVSPSAVSRIESGDRDPHLSTLRRYAMAVGAVIQHTVRRFEHTQVVDAWGAQAGAALERAWSEQGRNLDKVVQNLSATRAR